MNTKTITILAIWVLVLIPACSDTNQTATLTTSQLQSDEPFMAQLKEIATKREPVYFLGQSIDSTEYGIRVSDIESRHEYGMTETEPEEHFEGIPILMIRY